MATTSGVRSSLWCLPGGSDNARRLAALREESAQKERLGATFLRPPRPLFLKLNLGVKVLTPKKVHLFCKTANRGQRSQDLLTARSDRTMRDGGDRARRGAGTVERLFGAP